MIQGGRRQQYSAERMSLVVLGGQPLDTLQGWVSQRFSAVPAGRGPRPVFSRAGPPFQVAPPAVTDRVHPSHASALLSRADPKS